MSKTSPSKALPSKGIRGATRKKSSIVLNSVSSPPALTYFFYNSIYDPYHAGNLVQPIPWTQIKLGKSESDSAQENESLGNFFEKGSYPNKPTGDLCVALLIPVEAMGELVLYFQHLFKPHTRFITVLDVMEQGGVCLVFGGALHSIRDLVFY